MFGFGGAGKKWFGGGGGFAFENFGGSAGSTPLLDRLTVAPAIAFGMRKLRSAYGGPCMRIQRASDLAQTDIGFVGGLINAAAISAFGAATTMTLVKLYDQSGNGRDFTMSGGVLPAVTVVLNKPVITWGNGLGVTAGAVSLTAPKIYTVINSGSVVTNNYIHDCGSNDYMTQFNASALTMYNGTPVNKTPVATGLQQLSIIFQTGNDDAYINGTLLTGTGDAADTPRNSVITLGNYGPGGFPFIGNMYEWILVDGAAADRLAIQTSQKAFYGTP